MAWLSSPAQAAGAAPLGSLPPNKEKNISLLKLLFNPTHFTQEFLLPYYSVGKSKQEGKSCSHFELHSASLLSGRSLLWLTPAQLPATYADFRPSLRLYSTNRSLSVTDLMSKSSKSKHRRRNLSLRGAAFGGFDFLVRKKAEEKRDVKSRKRVERKCYRDILRQTALTLSHNILCINANDVT